MSRLNYTRTLKNGRVVEVRPGYPPLLTFLSRVQVDDSGCWLWTGPLYRTGRGDYGAMCFQGRSHGAHRVAWMLFRGPIPDGLEIDHLCEVKLCVNPRHLEPVTHVENVTRASRGASAVNRAKTHCKRGHPFDEANTILEPIGNRVGRRCRICVNELQRINRIKRLQRAGRAA